MPYGQRCPSCKQQTLHRRDEGRRCTTCGFVGWALQDGFSPGQGKGYRCPWCGKQTLHLVGDPANPDEPDEERHLYAARCTMCNFAGVGTFQG